MGNTIACMYNDENDSVNSEMLLWRKSMSHSRSKIFGRPGSNGIQSKSGETSLLEGRGTVPLLWRKGNLDADTPSWQVLWWEVE